MRAHRRKKDRDSNAKGRCATCEPRNSNLTKLALPNHGATVMRTVKELTHRTDGFSETSDWVRELGTVPLLVQSSDSRSQTKNEAPAANLVEVHGG